MKAKSYNRKVFRYISSGKPATVFVFCASTVLLYFSCYYVMQAIVYAESRVGPVLYDPLHAILPAPIDFSDWVFATTYMASLLTVVFSLKDGLKRVSYVFFGYSCILILRTFSLMTVALDPPVDMIPLADPLIVYCNPSNFVTTKDLFFSGHCASLFFFFLMANRPWLRKLMIVMNIFMIVAISWQRVHYTIDIIGGIAVAYLVAKLIESLFGKYMNDSEDKQATEKTVDPIKVVVQDELKSEV